MNHPEHRRSPRYACSTAVEVRSLEMRFPIRSLTTDVSETGCYVRNLCTGLRKGNEVEVVLWINGEPIVGLATVAAVHKGIGFGIDFKTLTGIDRSTLSGFLASLPESFYQTTQMLV